MLKAKIAGQQTAIVFQSAQREAYINEIIDKDYTDRICKSWVKSESLSYLYAFKDIPEYFMTCLLGGANVMKH